MDKKENRYIIQFLGKSVLGYALGMLYFIVVIMVPTDPTITVSSNHLPEVSKFVPNLFQNLFHYYKLVLTDFKPIWILIFVIMVVLAGIVCVSCSKQNKIMSVIMFIFYLVASLFICFGFYIALEQSPYAPRAMYGIGVFISLIALFVVGNTKKQSLYIPFVLLSWAFIVFAFIYGNALKMQKEYADFRVSIVINDIDELLVKEENPVNVQFIGTIGCTPAIRNMPQNYQMLNRLIPVIVGSSGWNNYRFYHYYGLENVYSDKSVDMESLDLPVMSDSIYHTIKGDKDMLLIELK